MSRIGRNASRGVFGVTKSESVVKIELGPFSQASNSIFTLNFCLIRERLVVRAHPDSPSYFCQVLLKYRLFSGKFKKRQKLTEKSKTMHFLASFFDFPQLG